MCSSVVLPLPDGPSTSQCSPCSASQSRICSASTPLYACLTSLNWNTGELYTARDEAPAARPHQHLPLSAESPARPFVPFLSHVLGIRRRSNRHSRRAARLVARD